MTDHIAHHLTAAQRLVAREDFLKGAKLLLSHAEQLHYTQDATLRWEGIHDRIDYRKGHFPRHGDCSSTGTYLVFVPLHMRFGLPDVVNGDHWRGGYTGTIAQHGRRVLHEKNLLPGDAILYGPAPEYEHVAWFMGRKHGVSMVFSHGSEGGPYFAPLHYRSDAGQFRRVIL